MEVVDNYLFIQKYRFGDKIEIRHNIPDEVLNFYIPSFIIQPVIETVSYMVWKNRLKKESCGSIFSYVIQISSV